MRWIVLLAGLWPGAGVAQDFALRDGDVQLSRAQMEERVIGTTLTFYDDGQSRFSPGGSYSYTYSQRNGGSSQFGTFTVLADGVICIVYRNGFDRCDMYVLSGGRLTVLTEDGNRYPVRPE